ncbi:MAG: hypothetical protein GY866_35375, partial [Proteobacteria bacterium]|nr:hypothetical protein [Pseudomonadota bacterium]
MTDETVFQHDFFDTSGMDDFIIKDAGDPPPGYPLGPRPDDYAFDPFESTYAARKEALFDHCCRNPAGPNIKGYYYELARLHKNRGPIHEGLILGVLGYIDQRYDCSDFVLLGMVRILYQFFEHPLLGSEIKERLVKTILDFKYHPEEPGIDSMCYWTENHQIMFAANEYLAGQKFPEAVFTNSGLTGKQKMAKAEKRILKWLELRFLTGFSEWLSHIYYDEDMTALINLVDFCDNPKIRQG